jgi:hypothetical protein
VDWAAWWIAHGEAVITLIVGAVIGGIINWVFFRRAEKPKRLSWEVMSRNRLISADAEERGRLEVLHDGDPVDEPNIIIVRLGNTGKREILEADFPYPIRLDFDAARVLTIQSMGGSDPGMSLAWRKDPNDASIMLAGEDGALNGKNPHLGLSSFGSVAPLPRQSCFTYPRDMTRLARRRHNLVHNLRPANVVEAFGNKRMMWAAT